MKKYILALIQEASKFEMDIYNLYVSFGKLFIEDSKFWETIAEEERNHAVIMQKSYSYLESDNKIFNQIIPNNIVSIIDNKEKIDKLITEFKKSPERTFAFNLALNIETSLFESTYQKFMASNFESKDNILFQKLNGDEKDHIRRIKQYMKVNNIPVTII